MLFHHAFSCRALTKGEGRRAVGGLEKRPKHEVGNAMTSEYSVLQHNLPGRCLLTLDRAIGPQSGEQGIWIYLPWWGTFTALNLRLSGHARVTIQAVYQTILRSPLRGREGPFQSPLSVLKSVLDSATS
jgi:hypothetical protein